jgi:hypothetical protein
MKQFGLVSEINIADENTWRNKYFITLDIDWAHDDVIQYAADLLIDNNIKATWFVTHDTPKLAMLKMYSIFELGIHPNFNLLLNGHTDKGANTSDVIDNLLKIIPNAKLLRSHSLTQNSNILHQAYDKGIRYDLNTFIPLTSKIEVRPYIHTSNLIQLPHIWEDDVHYINRWDYTKVLYDLEKNQGLKILDFHPIHIFLNTSQELQYTSTKHLHQSPLELIKFKNQVFGTEHFLKQIITE